MVEPQIQYAKTEDGVSIAYWTMGKGPAVVEPLPPPWSNIEFEAREWPLWEIMASRCTMVRYDHRGTGLSQRDVADFSLDSFVRDLEAVVDRLALKEFALLGHHGSGPIAIAYAARHPERVSHLLLLAAVARMTDYYELSRVRNAYNILEQGDWEMFTDALGLAFAGWSDAGLARDLSSFYRTCVDPEQARAVFEAQRNVDVTELLPLLRMPVSVVYPNRSAVSDIATARTLAAQIPDAHLTVVDSDTDWSPEVERAWFVILDRIVAEMGGTVPADAPPTEAGGVTHTILFTDMESSTALTQQLGDAAAQEVRRAHNDIVRAALSANDGSEIKHTGDGIMASFSTASSALECAIAIQRGVAAHKEEHPDSPLGVHVGLNAGEPIAEDDPDGRIDLFGTSVDLAARLVDHAQPGQIIASDVVRQLAAGKQFLFSDLGETELRGFEDPVKLWELRWQEQD